MSKIKSQTNGHESVIDILMDMNRSKRTSTYVLSAGKPSHAYIDIDNFYLGGEGDFPLKLSEHKRVWTVFTTWWSPELEISL